MKKELLEIKRILTIDRYNITRITGYIVDNDRNCRLEFVKNFLNLEETETFKYLDIFKKVLSGKPGRNLYLDDNSYNHSDSNEMDWISVVLMGVLYPSNIGVTVWKRHTKR